MGRRRNRGKKVNRKPQNSQSSSVEPPQHSTVENAALSETRTTHQNLVASASGSSFLDSGASSNEDEEIKKKSLLKVKIKRKYCSKFEMRYGLLIGELKMEVQHKIEENKVQKLYLGKPNHLPTKVVLLVGATGSGKTRLINAMANYILSVEFTDEIRFTIADQKEGHERTEASSQTDYITAFTFYNMPGMSLEFNYVLIDTPGFGDTRGVVRDREMMLQIETFLKQNYGIDQVDGVGFVIPASTVRLTQTQKYIIDGLSSMFGKDIKSNIFIMATFADALKPPVLQAIAEAGLEYSDVYKFNNSALYTRNGPQDNHSSDESDADDVDAVSMSRQYWDMADRSMGSFFKKLSKVSPVSLRLTKEVLEERRHLQTVLYSLQSEVRVGLDKLAILKQERQLLARLDDDVEGSRNYHMVVNIPQITEVRLRPDECVTNCLKCNATCHFPCYLPQTEDKERCAAMRNGKCEVCIGKCGWEVHKHMDFKYETTYKRETRTAKQIFKRFSQALSGKKTKQEVIRNMEEDINTHAKGLIRMINDIQRHVNRLEEIALKQNPLSTKDYIELMVESEKMQKLPNFERRIEILLKLKEEAQILEAATGIGEELPETGEALLSHFQDLIVLD